MPHGHYKKATVDSALVHLLNAIDAVKDVKNLENPLKSEVDKILRCIQNAEARVLKASAQHKRGKGNWKGADLEINAKLTGLESRLQNIRTELQKLSDTKKRKK